MSSDTLDALEIQQFHDGVTVKIKLQPRSSRSEVSGLCGDSVKACVNAPPADGEANQALIQLLSDAFNIPKSRIEIIAGHKNRNKRIKFSGVDSAFILRQLKAIFDL